MTKLVFISDTHKAEQDVIIPECDVLVHSGDIDANNLRDITIFNNWLGTLPFKICICVPGNHDFLFQNNLELCKQILTNAKVLVDEEFVYEGITFYGSPWTPAFFNWAFMKQRGEDINKFWKKIPSYTDVLVTHGPPYQILDYIDLHSGRVGCYDLLKAVERIKPKIHSFGHIHESYGTEEKVWEDGSKTLFINAAQMDGDYDLTNKPIVVEI